LVPHTQHAAFDDAEANASTLAQGLGNPGLDQPVEMTAGRTRSVEGKQRLTDADFAPPKRIQGDAAHHQIAPMVPVRKRQATATVGLAQIVDGDQGYLAGIGPMPMAPPCGIPVFGQTRPATPSTSPIRCTTPPASSATKMSTKVPCNCSEVHCLTHENTGAMLTLPGRLKPPNRGLIAHNEHARISSRNQEM